MGVHTAFIHPYNAPNYTCKSFINIRVVYMDGPIYVIQIFKYICVQQYAQAINMWGEGRYNATILYNLKIKKKK